MPLFSQADLHALKYGGISTPFREMPTRNAQINMDSVAKLGSSSPTKIGGDPYARPLSAKDLEGNIAQPQPVLSPQRQNSNSNFIQSSLSGTASRPTAALFTACASNTSTTTSASNASIQTNSFMRPQSALRDTCESPTKSDIPGSRHSILRPPSAAGYSPSQSSSTSRHSVTFADSSDSDNNNSTNVIPESEDEIISNGETVMKNSVNNLDNGFANLQETLLQSPPAARTEEKVWQQTAASSEFMRKFAMSEAGTKNTVHVTKMQNAQVYILKTELLDSKQPTTPSNTAVVNNSSNLSKAKGSKSEEQQYNMNNSAAGNKNNNIASGKTSSPTKISRDREIIFKPPSPKASRSATTSPQPPVNKVRNPRYTPTRPYSEVSDLALAAAQEDVRSTGDKSEDSNKNRMTTGATAIHIPNSTVSNSKDNYASPGLVTKPPKSGFVHGSTPTQMQMTNAAKQDGTMKKMPVTNTITGTIYYRKGSKGEEVLHEQRPKADGAPAKMQKVEKMASMMSNDGEEWEDDDDECEGESDSCPNR
jgi:hypothetical protein